MAFQLELIKTEDSEPVENLGTWSFNTMPSKGDEIELLHPGRVDLYEVTALRHKAVKTDTLAQAPNYFRGCPR